jgi:hypothetical protein
VIALGSFKKGELWTSHLFLFALRITTTPDIYWSFYLPLYPRSQFPKGVSAHKSTALVLTPLSCYHRIDWYFYWYLGARDETRYVLSVLCHIWSNQRRFPRHHNRKLLRALCVGSGYYAPHISGLNTNAKLIFETRDCGSRGFNFALSCQKRVY